MKEMEKIKEEYGRKCNVIKYNPRKIKSENLDVTFNIYKDEQTSNNLAVFILKYTLENDEHKVPYEVILGETKLKQNEGIIKEKAKAIRDCLLAQFKENIQGENNYEYCEKLNNICTKNGIEFIYTDEGLDMSTNDIGQEAFYERTYFLQEHKGIMQVKGTKGNWNSSFEKSQKDIEEKIKKNKREKSMIKTAIEELDEEGQKQFNKGMKISKAKNVTSKEIMFLERKNVARYLISQFEKEDGETSKIAERYFRIKERGISSNIINCLENREEQTEYIQDCTSIFRLVSEERDFNSQFVYLYKTNGFDELKSIIEEQKESKRQQGQNVSDEIEINQYLQLKENVLKNAKLDRKLSFLDKEMYNDKAEISELFKFVMESRVRRETREEEKQVVSQIYQEIVDNEYIKKNMDEVNLYNSYATRFNLDICPTEIKEFKDTKKQEEVGESR